MCQKNVIDGIEERATAVRGCSSYGAVDISDFNTLLRLARLAERTMDHWEDRMTGTNIHPTSAALCREIRAILCPAPKGDLVWQEHDLYCSPVPLEGTRIASGLTLNEAKRRMGA